MSTDLSSHLRTVHFALIVTCVTSVAALVGFPSNLASAKHELNAVQAIRSGWASWLDAFGVDQEDDWKRRGLLVADVPTWLYSCQPDGKNWSVRLLGSPIRLTLAGRGQFAERWLADGDTSPSSKTIHLVHPEQPDGWPKTLADFRDFWEAADNLQVSTVKTVAFEGHNILNGVDVNHRSLSVASCPGSASGFELTLRREAVPPCTELVDRAMGSQVFCTRGELAGGALAVPVTMAGGNVSTLRSWLLRRFNIEAPGLGFSTDFPRLAEATTTYAGLPLNNVQLVLDHEIERSSERLQVMGVTLSVRFLGQTAVALVVLIQFYLLIHLQRFALFPEAADSAWVGFYDHLTARLATVLTAVLLPTVTVAYVALSQFSWWAIGSWTILSLAIALVTWRLLGRVPAMASTATTSQ
jgi:hypothetical protein